MVGEGRTRVLLVAAGGCGSWCAAGQVRQDGCGSLLVARLEVAEGFFGCCRLLTAVWRIENGTPRRRINLDEALAFSRVFELPLEELMSPPLEGLDIDSRRLVQEAVEAFYEARDARDRLHHAVVAIADHIKAHPDSSRAIHEQCLRLMGDERDARTLSNDIADGGHY
ncbi:hypothetical protein [Streptomyces sp. NBC_00525]|uniref:hypothetical protein n=1 Tax=Streptomyces sp. NBC_00525 TaxID=2903660 RepID=UPI002E803EE0|nr:hypothetical protein [Streptomyces sp. NBC_00525]WUC95752.1 hypothetical protein OG710_20055 [Streptomyces sp. NBC_00525]